MRDGGICLFSNNNNDDDDDNDNDENNRVLISFVKFANILVTGLHQCKHISQNDTCPCLSFLKLFVSEI